MSDLVSVIIPSFDRGHVVREAVDSVLGQLHGHVEVIVVDDGSSDATREIVETAYGAEPRVRYRYQPNAGDLPLGTPALISRQATTWHSWTR